MIISHPTGNQNVRNAALALQRADLLDRYFTTVAWKSNSALSKLLPGRLQAMVRRREYSSLPQIKITTHPPVESCRLVSIMLKLNFLTKHETGICCTDAVYRSLDRYIARHLAQLPPPGGIYAYEDCALKTFFRARELNIKTNYEIPSAYWYAGARIFQEEAELNPEWSVTIGVLNNSEEKLQRKDEELSLADKIFVASTFTAGNVASYISSKQEIAVIPYGAPPPVQKITPSNKKNGLPLRVLFVGSLTQGKGLSYMFHAIDMLKDKVSLTVVGRRNYPCKPLDSRLEECRYIPSLPHNKVLEKMKSHDVLVFPSLWDGFGLVILEAMSQGIPVIASTNTGGPDVIQDGVDGCIVPVRSAEAIAEKLDMLACNEDILNSMKSAALRTAARYSWERYQSEFIKNVVY